MILMKFMKLYELILGHKGFSTTTIGLVVFYIIIIFFDKLKSPHTNFCIFII